MTSGVVEVYGLRPPYRLHLPHITNYSNLPHITNYRFLELFWDRTSEDKLQPNRTPHLMDLDKTIIGFSIYKIISSPLKKYSAQNSKDLIPSGLQN